ncbi:MAG TPA: hypothetical protein VMN78_07640 [Longimicrobiales bacterium]|nr:hypothetical protein [Longimicrobiales bacterium]
MSGATHARTDRARDERGFVLILVLFVVATLTVTVSGALLVTQSDYMTARTGVGATRAFHLAQAGLNRYMGEHTAPVDSAVYSMGGGSIIVRAARVAVNGTEEIWEISSSATLSSSVGSPERRSVRQLAAVQAAGSSFQPIAAIATTASSGTLNGTYTGYDQAASGSCPTAGQQDIAGVAYVAGGFLGASGALGTPATTTEPDTATMRASINAQWATLVDPATPFNYEIPADLWPNFAMLPADEYPSIRVSGNHAADATRSGRGLLVVDGVLDLKADFTWDGVIIAGDLQYPVVTNAVISGALVVGMSQTAGSFVEIRPNATGSAQISYQACHVAAANPAGGGGFALVPNTWSEPPIY